MAKFAYRVPRGPLPAVLPVGSPLPECHAIVMWGENLCGVGETGEIVIRTPFRTLGYLDNQAATDVAFFRNPRRDDDRDLLYRTGDLGRFRPDGVLEIVGRRDHQIKISGVRIQPAEVENALVRHDEVSACIVVARKDPREEVHLIAYVVALDAAPGLEARLRAHLTELLPRAMVPGEFLVIDHIPMTPNGKPDRAALPEPLFATEEPRPFATAPATGTEHTIRDAWAAVLLRPVDGVSDDFFALGGTSLKLLRLYALLDERFPRTFRVAQLFTYPTIALQAALVDPAGSRTEDEVFEHDF